MSTIGFFYTFFPSHGTALSVHLRRNIKENAFWSISSTSTLRFMIISFAVLNSKYFQVKHFCTFTQFSSSFDNWIHSSQSFNLIELIYKKIKDEREAKDPFERFQMTWRHFWESVRSWETEVGRKWLILGLGKNAYKPTEAPFSNPVRLNHLKDPQLGSTPSQLLLSSLIHICKKLTYQS